MAEKNLPHGLAGPAASGGTAPRSNNAVTSYDSASRAVAQPSDALGLLLEPGSVAELRILNTRQGTVSGYFNDRLKLAAAAAHHDGKVPAIYVTLNPVNPALLARAANKLIPYAKATTTDSDIVKRRWLPVDFDPVRPSGVSSTDVEHDAALERAKQAREWLAAQGWPEPIYADSGNGAHLLYRIDLPNDAAATELVRKCLEALAFEFSDDVVQIDAKTFNPARIWKLYGTLSCKGDNLPERPHRRSKIIDAPRELRTVSVGLLEALARRVPEAPKQLLLVAGPFDLARWIAEHDLPVVASGPWQGGRRWILNPCPFEPSHDNRAAFIVQFPSGAIAAGCHHNSCSWGWKELRARYEPEAARWTTGANNGKAHRAVEVGEVTQSTAAVVVRLADVAPERVRWLWPGRIPLGKLTILDGDPGLGKSLLTLDLAARVSRGAAMPDGTASELEVPAGVVLLSVEDDPADTIRPRLDAAGADCSRIVLLQGVEEVTTVGETTRRTVRLPTLADVDAIGDAIRQVGAKLVIVDPVMAFTGGADTHVDSEVRGVLARLAQLAQETGVAIVAVRHLNKAGGGNPLYRGGGSIGFIASARAGLLVAPDPDDPEGKRRVLAATKSNLAELPPSLAYTVEAPDGVARLRWLGSSEQTAKTLLAVPTDGDEKTALDEARDFLRDLLAEGPVEVKQVKAEAREAGISERTLARAKTQLGVEAVKTGFGEAGKWQWVLPKQTSEQPKSAKDPKSANPYSMASLGDFGTL